MYFARVCTVCEFRLVEVRNGGKEGFSQGKTQKLGKKGGTFEGLGQPNELGTVKGCALG